MPAEIIKKSFKGSELPLIDWEKDFQINAEERFTVVLIKENTQNVPKAISDNLIEINGQVYELDLSEDLPMSEICAELGDFEFLEDEPELYSVEDLKKRHV
ncbi:hypothetical protein MTBBW1_2480001 [Desulfamplus magnetovallimortis]|uniref:Uncharacterized protein n=1 Tax=Desulfamplus magnetovallimortis TaxID=1246637 RepID=A0A1W1HEM4_9BACT|nr:hypothetical protein [Desulfamplus magnetovallimortis]SLM30822.1 hypothetical protein MTBBW1_2480001 [Desulfamplus magnetovallimortis]